MLWTRRGNVIDGYTYIYYSHLAKDHFYFWAYVKINILFGLY